MPSTFFSRLRFGLAALLLCASATPTVALEIRVDANTTLSVERFSAARARAVLVVMPSEDGPHAAHTDLAQALASLGNEVWLPDLLGAYFQNATASGIDAIPADAVAALIQAAAERSARPVYLFSHDRGAALALRGARRWQVLHPDSDALGGAILVSPNLLTQTPEAGHDAQHEPIASATSVPVYVLQPRLAVGYWQLATLRVRLAAGGSAVTLRTLPEVRDRFFFRPDATAQENQAALKLPQWVDAAVKTLEPLRRAHPAAPLAESKTTAPSRRGLVEHRGTPTPPPLTLRDRAGQSHSLAALRGRVVLVNFWASWCPPCVHEMPSMQQLATDLRNAPFTLLTVNMAEDDAAVAAFLHQHRLDFTVLMDRDGTALQQWKVMAFPTSFVIDKTGRIRYSAFGAIDWMEPQVLDVLRALTRAD